MDCDQSKKNNIWTVILKGLCDFNLIEFLYKGISDNLNFGMTKQQSKRMLWGCFEVYCIYSRFIE